MADLKMGKQSAPREAGKKFERIKNQPVSKRIADFLIDEGKKEKGRDNAKKIARPNISQDDLAT